MRFLLRAFISWLPLAVAITGVCLLVYATVQQNYRQSLNDPQVQMAEDAAAALVRGDVPASLVTREQPLTDIGQSLAPWIAVYDERGASLESSGVLNGAPPKPPVGVFDAARQGLPLIVDRHLTNNVPANENRITWQPASGVRTALVVVWVPETKQFVVAGRNMREVERREGNLSFTVFAAWLVLLGTTFAAKAFQLKMSE